MSRLKIKSRYFKLLLLSVAIVLTLLTVVYIVIYFSMVQKQEGEFAKASLDDLSTLANVEDSLFTAIGGTSFQIAMMPLLNKIATDPEQAGQYDYLTLKNEIGNYVISNNILQSIYVYFKPNGRVLTAPGGMYSFDEFYDKEIISWKRLDNENAKSYFARNIKEVSLTDGNSNVLTIVRDIPIGNENPSSKLIINIKEDSFYKEVEKLAFNNLSMFMVDENFTIISHKTKPLIGMKMNEAYSINEKLSGNQDIKTVTIGGKKYFLLYVKSHMNDWKFVSIISHEVLDEQKEHTTLVITRVFIIVVVFVVIIGYFFIKNMYSPLRNLIFKIGNHMRSLGVEEGDGDEYGIVSTAFDRLISENQNVNTLIKKYTLVLREKFLSDILLNNMISEEEIKQKNEFAGIAFNKDSFITAVASILGLERKTDPGEIVYTRLYVSSVIESEMGKSLDTWCIMLEEDTAAVILNFQYDSQYKSLKDKLKEVCSNINLILKGKMEVKVYFSFGGICHNVTEIGKSFAQARKNIGYKAVSDETDMIFYVSETNHVIPVYPMAIHKHIVNGIKSGNEDVIKSAIDKFFDECIYDAKYAHERLQQLVLVMISSVMSEFWQESENPEVMSGLDIIGSVTDCSNSEELKSFMINSYLGIMGKRNESIEKQPNEAIYISKIVHFINENYMNDISLVDIAESVNLNPTYLSKLFKAATGRTVTEYLTLLRIRKAKEMFSDERLSMKEISSSIGYNDVHSFIRFFKKYEGVTPGEYREANVKKSI